MTILSIIFGGIVFGAIFAVANLGLVWISDTYDAILQLIFDITISEQTVLLLFAGLWAVLGMYAGYLFSLGKRGKSITLFLFFLLFNTILWLWIQVAWWNGFYPY